MLNPDENYFWQKVVANLAYDTKHRYSSKNYRDSIMAGNLLSLVTQQYSKEKIICWSATSHFIYNPKQISYKDYAGFIPMGEYLHQKLAQKLFTIGFTSYEGKAGSIITHQLKKPSSSSNEDIVGQMQYSYAFTNLRAVSTDTAGNSSIECRMLGNTFMKMLLPKVADGLFYIKTAYPPELK
ncbi:MAG: hypothetical protein EOP45_01830 [Sphingobacteriaceae bacterium]|nr:MAG: hypothetical protein EOP45_01830 [Sphingobacteriaceae bacterium]